jgi:hypothetical protein
MTEPSAIWSLRQIVTDNSISTTQNVILSYARNSLHTMIRNIDRVHQQTKVEGDNHIVYGEDLPSLLSDIVFHQGLASTLLFRDGPKGNGESQKAFASRSERAAYVAQKCDGLSLDALKNKKVRNSIAHLDEYLVEELAAESTGWWIDTVQSRRDMFTAPNNLKVAFCRSYIIGEDKLLNFGNEIVLSDLKREAEQVLAAIWLEPAPK